MIDYLSLIMYFVILAAIFSIASMSLNLEAGVTGLPNFGQVGFLALGAFVAGTVTVTLGMLLTGISGQLYMPATTAAVGQLGKVNPLFDVGAFILGMLLSIAIGGIAGMVASYPSIRLYEDYLGITLLAIAEVIRLIQNNFTAFAGGTYGLPYVPGPLDWMRGTYGTTAYYAAFMSLVIILAFLCFLYYNKLLNSPYGRVLRAIRDNEVVAKSLGKDISRTKIQVMVVGSALTSMAGALYVYFVQSVSNDNYLPAITFVMFLMVLLGGAGNFKGAVVGAAIYEILDVGTSFISPALYQYVSGSMIAHTKFLVTGALILLILLYRPRGLLPEQRIKTGGWEILGKQRRS
ncbi:MAG: branched-chain amino acid ABC transporter permease [Candidatus Bathyarchaeia archaeon]|jgi:branched-chain amino acid transport system permease protein